MTWKLGVGKMSHFQATVGLHGSTVLLKPKDQQNCVVTLAQVSISQLRYKCERLITSTYSNVLWSCGGCLCFPMCLPYVPHAHICTQSVTPNVTRWLASEVLPPRVKIQSMLLLCLWMLWTWVHSVTLALIVKNAVLTLAPSRKAGWCEQWFICMKQDRLLAPWSMCQTFLQDKENNQQQQQKMCFFIDPLLTVVMAGWAMTHLHEWTTPPKHLNNTLCNICCNSVPWFKHFCGKR